MENETPLDTEPCWLDRDTHQFTIENRVCRIFNGGPQRFQPHTAGIETCPLPLCPWLSSSCKAGGLQRSIALRKFIFKEFSSQSQHGSFLSVLLSVAFFSILPPHLLLHPYTLHPFSTLSDTSLQLPPGSCPFSCCHVSCSILLTTCKAAATCANRRCHWPA